MDQDRTSYGRQDENNAGDDQRKILSIVAYIPFLCFIPLFSRDGDETTRAHGRQGLILMALEIFAAVMLLIGKYFWIAIILAAVMFSVAGIVAAFSGRDFIIPVIGKYADRLK